MNSTPKVLVTCRQMQVELPKHSDRIRRAGYEPIAPEMIGQHFDSAQLLAMSRGVVGMIAGDDELDRAFLEGSPELKVLIRWGIGMDSVDHAAAKEVGIAVRNTPGVFGQEVADSAFAYILMLARGHHLVDTMVRLGEWPKYEGTTLAGANLGIVGYGAIGRAVADRGRGFGMDVSVFDPYILASDVSEGVNNVEFTDLLEASHFVVLTCPLTEETLHMINEVTLRHMPKSAYLINVARGPVVDERSLIQALSSGSIAGAALDVFEVEPLPDDSELRRVPNVILGAHNGSNTRQGVEIASARAVDFLLEELAK